MKHRRIIFVALLIALVIGLGWLALRTPGPPDPVYKGKPLSKWLEGFDPLPTGGVINPRPTPMPPVTTGSTMVPRVAMPTPPPSPEWLAAQDALEHFGTNALPTIVWMLRARDPAWRLRILQWVRKQHVVPIRYTYASHWNRVAVLALEMLGPRADSAVPAMAEVYDTSLSSEARAVDHDYPAEYLVLTLPPLWGKLGPAGRGAIPSLLRGAAFTNANIRWVAVTALGDIHAEPATVVPLLTGMLQDPDWIVRQNAVTALSKFGADANLAVPAMIGLLEDKEHWVRNATLHALGTLHANPSVVIPALAKALENSTNNSEAFDIVLTLQKFGPDARPAVPAMIESLKRQPNENIRGNIRLIIREIDPEAAAKAGIQ